MKPDPGIGITRVILAGEDRSSYFPFQILPDGSKGTLLRTALAPFLLYGKEILLGVATK